MRSESGMKRTPLQRKTPLRSTSTLARSPMKRSRPKATDRAVVAQVVLRDGGCVARSQVPEVRCAGRIDPHHVLPRGRGGKDTTENLICLCRAHHDWVHSNPSRAYDLGFLARSEG